MEPFTRIRELADYWPYLFPMLAMLAGAAVSLIAFFSGRRRLASFLGATGFGMLFLANVLLMLVRLVVSRPNWRLMLSVLLVLLNTVAIALLIVAVLVRDTIPQPPEETEL